MLYLLIAIILILCIFNIVFSVISRRYNQIGKEESTETLPPKEIFYSSARVYTRHTYKGAAQMAGFVRHEVSLLPDRIRLNLYFSYINDFGIDNNLLNDIYKIEFEQRDINNMVVIDRHVFDNVVFKELNTATKIVTFEIIKAE